MLESLRNVRSTMTTGASKVRNRIETKVDTTILSLPGPVADILLPHFASFSRRELRTVRSGIHANAVTSSGGFVYVLRRHIHMMEKGLSMSPRRPTFGEDYVQSTIYSFRRLSSAEGGIVGTDEYAWMRDVLEAYFEATHDSPSPKIAAAREAFRESVQEASPGMRSPQPFAKKTADGLVPLESLQALAIGRQSVRWYEDRPVPRASVDAAVKVAAQAPSACNRQPVRFLIFDSPESARSVAAVAMGTKGYAEQLPALAVVVGNQAAYADPRDRHLVYIDGSLAAMSFIFGLEAQGVSSCCINWPDIGSLDRQMRQKISLAPYEQVIMLIAYGYGREGSLNPFSEKKSLERMREYRVDVN